jgi:TolA-binding protein
VPDLCDNPGVPPLHPEWQRVFDRLEREAASANARADALQVTLRNLEAALEAREATSNAQQARLEAMMKSLQTRLDEVSGHAAAQNDELRSIRSLLRRRETQLDKANAEVRKLRRKLGLDDPDPDPPSAPPAPEATPKPAAKEETRQIPDNKGKGPRADTSEGEAEAPEAPPEAPTDDPDVSRTEVAAE